MEDRAMRFERLTDSGPKGAGLGAFAKGETPKPLGALFVLPAQIRKRIAA